MHPTATVERDKTVYDLATRFLFSIEADGLTPAIIEKYLAAPTIESRPDTIPAIYEDLLFSAQNANMKANVIGGALGGVERLGIVLGDFDPGFVAVTYNQDWELLLDTIQEELAPRGRIRRTKRSVWPSYCRTILTGATFMLQFNDADEFYDWVDRFDKDDLALPTRISAEVHGLGFALACDFLKELGYSNYAKPDGHLHDIFSALELYPPGRDNYQLFKAITRMARNVGETPYHVDKLFWLIGSGFFYDDPQIGNEGRIGRRKEQFIEYALNSPDWDRL